MSNDRDKLLTIINNLELDYRSGNISKDKYEYLLAEYNRRLNIIERSNNNNIFRDNNSIYTGNLDDSNQKNQLEDQELINKFIVRKNNTKKKKKSIGRKGIIAIATFALLIAFAGGIGFGIFNIDFNAEAMALFGQASISDTAFPVVVPNVTVNNTNFTSSYTNYTSKYSNYSNTHHNSNSSSGGSSSGGRGSGGSDDDSSSSSSGGGNGRSNIRYASRVIVAKQGMFY